ncbi:MAG: hypothetical protein H5T85_01295 [Actinobacteria bacterium]|nr:hypothetical protein [Actinomycetota bacterium]
MRNEIKKLEGFVLGVDGGGTKTTIQIADINGKLISEVESGPANYKSVGIENAKLNIIKAVLNALRRTGIPKEVMFLSACFGISGNDNYEDEEIYRKIIFDSELRSYLNPFKAIICNDTKIGLAAGTDNRNGVIIICGTGSNCYGTNEAGQ